MGLESLYLPQDYENLLNIIDTEIAIKTAKDCFEKNLAEALSLTRVSAPLFVEADSGLNDDLNGTERPVAFDILETKKDMQIVHSLAKWKRLALKRYGFPSGTGLYTDMNAIRRDEELDNLHSVYVDQWDWEKIISASERNLDTLKQTVNKIMNSIIKSEKDVCDKFPQIKPFLSKDVFFITTAELLDMYPDLSPKERENTICKEHKTVFLMQIGDVLKDGKKHDGRAPDYDDWNLNGDLLVWYPVLDRAVELSSMGIRVDKKALLSQLKKANCEERKNLLFHAALLNDELPLTMGGGIGQSRICMILLHKAHIGEVQASSWPLDMIEECSKNGINLL